MVDPLPNPTPSLLEPRLLWATAALIATLLLAAVILAWFDRWRKRPDRSSLTPADELNAFRLSYEQGELSQQEYDRIRAKLAPRIKRQFGVTDKTAAPTNPERPRPATDSPPAVEAPGVPETP